MIVNLVNGYFTEIDEMNITLKQKYTYKDKQGNQKETERVIGYFTTMEGAIKRFLNHNQIDLLSDTAMKMEEYIKSIKDINETAVRQFKTILEGVMDDGK